MLLPLPPPALVHGGPAGERRRGDLERLEAAQLAEGSEGLHRRAARAPGEVQRAQRAQAAQEAERVVAGVEGEGVEGWVDQGEVAEDEVVEQAVGWGAGAVGGLGQGQRAHVGEGAEGGEELLLLGAEGGGGVESDAQAQGRDAGESLGGGRGDQGVQLVLRRGGYGVV
jgi:hypothetical protein